MTKYKLTYFNILGLGEPIRMLLSYGGVDFEDNRINFADWPKVKTEMPMNQMPILEIDRKSYHQSRAIGRYFAKKFGLYGKDDLEAMEIDAAIDDMEDWRMFIGNYMKEETPEFKAKLKNIAEEKMKFYLTKFEEQVSKNGEFMVGNTMTWADIHFAATAEHLNYGRQDILEKYTKLKNLYNGVRSNPKIEDYIRKRPKTPF